LKTIGLAGNPNSGKTTLFNALTGLRQKTGNYPGITTEVHSGTIDLLSDTKTHLLDLPGAYSLYPNTSDEFELVKLILADEAASDLNLILYVADVTELDKQLLLLTQLLDLGLPCVMILTMLDKLDDVDAEAIKSKLEAFFNIPVFLQNKPGKANQSALKSWLKSQLDSPIESVKHYYELTKKEITFLSDTNYLFPTHNLYRRLLYFHHQEKTGIPKVIDELPTLFKSERTKLQIAETLKRYESLQVLEHEVQRILRKPVLSRSDKLDRVVTHPIFGALIFFAILLFIFQAIYAWSELPMNWIDQIIAVSGNGLRNILGETMVADFLVDGLLAGLGGIIVFVPQIAILFFLLGLMEESGYMARVVYMFDHVMRRFGLSGRSLVSLMSAGACAIPAVMSARSIENEKERLITILVSPFVSCSARIPVYTILIGLAVPAITVFGVFNLKGLVFTSLYFASVLAALIFGFLLKLIFKRKNSSELLIELPHYKMPQLKDVLIQMWNKTKSFVLEAGKIILIISMILWFLGSFGPGEAMLEAENEARIEAETGQFSPDERDSHIGSKKLEASYAGIVGKWMEPVIEPLGYDWKIGIALLASFAAREVFVGTMATIYSMGDNGNEDALQTRLSNEINQKTGKPVFNFATSMSLLVFFLLAMQCMSTLAIVKRETGTWKWPILQFIGMSALAYIAAFLVYQYLS